MKRKFLTILLLLITPMFIYGQTKNKSELSATMAKKISYYCQYNKRALSLFKIANSDIIQYRNDLAFRLLDNLEKRIDCAENFIITLYYNYGVEMSYFALKDAGFTVREIDIAESIWNKENAKQRKIESEKEIEKSRQAVLNERKLLKSATIGESFDYYSLSEKPDIFLNLNNLIKNFTIRDNLLYIGDLKWEDCFFECAISKDGSISLLIQNNLSAFSEVKRNTYEYLINNSKVVKLPSIKLNHLDTTIAVSTKVEFGFKHEPYLIGNSIEFQAKKNKKTNRWEILSENYLMDRLKKISEYNSRKIYNGIEYLLQTNPYFTSIANGTYKIKIDVLENQLIYSVNEDIKEVCLLPFSFDFECTKINSFTFF